MPPGTIDLAVNVWPATPEWLRDELARLDLTAYPDGRAATAAAAARHGLGPAQCLLTNGAAEAFWALAFGIRPRHAVCVHPSFTAPEAALRAAGVAVTRVVRQAEDGFALRTKDVPRDADLVVLGRPDNPTGRLEDAALIEALVRPGRVIVVDEAFADFLPGAEQANGLAGLQIPGVVCVRSLTKLWGLPGLRVGYLTGPTDIVTRARTALQPWPVSTPALHAIERLTADEREPERAGRAKQVAEARQQLDESLGGITGIQRWTSPANFLLLRTDAVDNLREALLEHGLAARRCSSFPGLDDSYVRVAVPLDGEVRKRLVSALEAVTADAG